MNPVTHVAGRRGIPLTRPQHKKQESQQCKAAAPLPTPPLEVGGCGERGQGGQDLTPEAKKATARCKILANLN